MLAGAIHGVSYSQMPLDLAKGFATSRAPRRRSCSGRSRACRRRRSSRRRSPWPRRCSWSGSPSSTRRAARSSRHGDFAFNGPDGGGVRNPAGGPPPTYYLANGGVSWPTRLRRLGRRGALAPGRWLDGTLGIYYRRYTDKFAAVLVTANPGGVGAAQPGDPLAVPVPPVLRRGRRPRRPELRAAGPRRERRGGGVASATTRRSSRSRLASRSPPAPALRAVLFPHGAAAARRQQLPGARRHAPRGAERGRRRLRRPGVLHRGWAVEVTYSRWLDVRENQDMFYARGYGVCRSDPALRRGARARRRGTAAPPAITSRSARASRRPGSGSSRGVDLLAPLSVLLDDPTATRR